MIKSLFSKKKNSKLNIVIAGGTGLIGQALQDHFKGSADVRVLSTRKNKHCVHWNPNAILQENDISEDLAQTIQNCDVLINLAGYSVGKGRFSKKHKDLILKSRKESTAAIGHLLHHLKPKACHWIQASATGYYGDTSQKKSDESSPNGHTFLANVCKEWESIATISSKTIPNCTLSICRIGLVLDKNADAWKKMIIPIKLGISGPLGSGSQWWSWIHLNDIVSGMDFLIKKQLGGIFNFTSPTPYQQRKFNAIIANHYNRPSLIPTPKLALKLALGDAANELLLNSCYVKPTALLNAGYSFIAPTLKDALKNL